MSSTTGTKHHHGRAYQCRHCLRSGKEYIQEKQRVEDHIRKTHLAPDQLPFYCTLCLFRCTRRDDLLKHVNHYRCHAARLIDDSGNKIPDSPQYLVANQDPYVIGQQDYLVLSKEDSEAYFQQRREAKRAASGTGDLLALAVQELGTPESFQDLMVNPGQTVNQVPTISMQQVPSTSCIEPALPAQLPISQILTAVQLYCQSLQQPTGGMVLSTPAGASVVPAVTDVAPISADVVPTSARVVPVTTDVPTSTRVVPAVTDVAPISADVVPTSARVVPATTDVLTSTRVVPATTDVPTSTRVVPATTDVVPTSTGVAPATTDVVPTSTHVPVPAAPSPSISSTASSSPNSNAGVFRPWLVTSEEQPWQTLGEKMSKTKTVQPLTAPHTVPGAQEKMPQTKTVQPLASPHRVPGAQETEEAEEDILPQLLGDQDDQLETQQDTRNVQIMPISRHLDALGATLKQMSEAISEGNATLRRELESNSRTVRCLEKTVDAGTKEQNRLLNNINNNLVNLITFLRTNAREERHRREEEEQKDERKRKREDENEEPKLKSVLGEVKVNKKKKRSD